MNLIKKKTSIPTFYYIGIVLLLVCNPCFYNTRTMVVYMILGFAGIVFILGEDLYTNQFKVIIDDCILWLILIYAIILLYGLLFLRASEFQWDYTLFTLASNIAIYVVLSKMFSKNNYVQNLSVFSVAAIITLAYLIYTEAGTLGQASIRLGSSMGGNVNTVGVCLGVLSIFLAFFYILSKNYFVLSIYLADSAIMLLTGSKKTVFFLISTILLFLMNSKGKKARNYLLLAVFIFGAYYLVMNVPYFYSVIGIRIDGMLGFYSGNVTGYQIQSTLERQNMISEGWTIFLNHPVFGGGQGYFALMSTSGYGYSHCNYIEMLCNMGVFGTVIYYTPAISNLIYMIRHRGADRELTSLGIIMIITMLAIDWMMVSYSSMCYCYIPVLTSFSIKKKIEKEMKHVALEE